MHDIRHTNVSFLIAMGCTPLLIAEHLGQERIQTTMDIYCYLYQNKQREVDNQLDVIAVADDGYKKSADVTYFLASKKQKSRKVL